MGPGPEVVATTDTRRWWPALRPVLLLGGFLLAWWFLMAGTAQAADRPEPGIGHATRALAGAAHGHSDRSDRPAHRAVGGERRAPHPAATKVAQAVRHQVASVVTMSERTVERTTEQPLVRAATDAGRSTVSEVADRTRSALQSTPLGSAVVPALDQVGQLGQDLPSVGESSTLVGETLSKHPPGHPTTTAPSTQSALGTGTTAADATTQTRGEDRASSPAAQIPADDVPWLSWRSGTVSAQSGSGAGAATDASEAGLFHDRATATSTSSSSAARLPAGPAYPPGSSPD